MKKAVIFGAGNVGRGFIAQLCSEAGMQVTFFDMMPSIIDAINQDQGYPHYTISAEGRNETWIKPAHAEYSSNQAAVNQEILEADLIATAVGANILPKIAHSLSVALEARIKAQQEPVNILLCENLHGAADLMRECLHQYLSEVSSEKFDENVGLLTTSIGRMIPAPSEELRALHPAAIQVEPYKFLPYDINAVKGKMPEIPYLHGDSSVDFSFYADRKLYVHNMGHAMSAYLARFYSYEYIWEAIADPSIRYFVHQAMNETAHALSKKYSQKEEDILAHVSDLLYRFSNKLLKDTTERVGRDPKRKLAQGDRFLGAVEMCKETKSEMQFLSLGLAAGLHYLKEDESWTNSELEDYLHEQSFTLNKERDSHSDLLNKQFSSLSEGFDFSQQLALLNEKFHISSII